MKHMTCRPLKTEVEAVLHQLTRETVDERRPVFHDHPADITYQEAPGVQALVIEQDRIRMSLRVLDKASRPDVLFESVAHVAQMLQPEGLDQVYLYGDPLPDTPHIWRTIRVTGDRVASNTEQARKLRRLWSADFAPATSHQSVMSIMRTVNPAESDAFASELFRSKTPYVNIDMDIDAEARQVHSRELGLNRRAQHTQPSNDSVATDTQLRAHWDIVRRAQTSLRYPDDIRCLNREEEAKQWAAQEKVAPADFSMEQNYKRALAEDEEFEDPEPIALVRRASEMRGESPRLATVDDDDDDDSE